MRVREAPPARGPRRRTLTAADRGAVRCRLVSGGCADRRCARTGRGGCAMIACCGVSSWGVSRIRAACEMTMAAEPDPDARRRATDGAAGGENDRQPPRRGELRLVSARRGDPRPSAAAAAVCSPAGGGSSSGASAWGRRLRLAPPMQLELVSAGEGPAPEVVWASLPQPSREMGAGVAGAADRFRRGRGGRALVGGVEKISSEHLARIAFTYVRQSTRAQVRNNTESHGRAPTLGGAGMAGSPPAASSRGSMSRER